MTGALLPPSSSRDYKLLEQRVKELERRLGNDPTDRRRPRRVVTSSIRAAYGGQSIPNNVETRLVFAQPPFMGSNVVVGTSLTWTPSTGIGVAQRLDPTWVLLGVTVKWNNYGPQGARRSTHIIQNGDVVTDDHESDPDGIDDSRSTYAFPLLLEPGDTFELAASHDAGFAIQVSDIKLRAVVIG